MPRTGPRVSLRVPKTPTDAYRTRYGIGDVQFALTVFFGIIAAMAAVFGIISAIKSLMH